VKGEGGGILIVLTLVGGADMGGSGFPLSQCFALSQLQQLLALDEAGEILSAGAEVGVKLLDVDEDVTEAMEERFPSKTNLELVPVDMGLISTGERVFRKSR
jgi:hypothetical protein